MRHMTNKILVPLLFVILIALLLARTHEPPGRITALLTLFSAFSARLPVTVFGS